MRNTKCQRCSTGNEVRYRAYTDVMEIDICTQCAKEARRLGMSLALLVDAGHASSPSKSRGDRSAEMANSIPGKRYLPFRR